MKKAIIVGSEGQDGRIAFNTLCKKGYWVLGLGKNIIKSSGVEWNKTIDVTDHLQVQELVKLLQPDEIYYLAACHQSSEDQLKDNFDLFQRSYGVNVLGLVNFLEGIKKYSASTRIFYASSSLIFEGTTTSMQDENTAFCPESIYGITKLDGLLLGRYYRSQQGIFACGGILYNHESIFRRENFISKKIVKAAVNIKHGKQDELILGNLNAEVDWGYAPDYVQAMQMILAADKADDFIISSGEKHSVQDFVQTVFDLLELDWKKYVKESPGVVTRKNKTLVGDPGKLKNLTGWRPTVNFKGLVKLLLEAENAGSYERV